MKLLNTIKTIIAIACFCTTALGQNLNRISLNVEVGLPSNNVYSVITDANNYLWFATDNGIARYNGYELKTFTTEQGLPTNDVWQLLEDPAGRIWIGCIANKFGYIQNEHYKTAIFKDSIGETIYPNGMRIVDSNIRFSSAYLNNHLESIAFFASNDTIRGYSVILPINKIIPGADSQFYKIVPLTNFDNNGNCYYLQTKHIVRYAIQDRKLNILSHATIDDPHLNNFAGWGPMYAVNNHIIAKQWDTTVDYFYAINGFNGRSVKISIGDAGIHEPIVNIRYNPNHNSKTLAVTTEHYVLWYDVDNVIRFKKAIAIAEITGRQDVGGKDVLFAAEDNLWGIVICTRKHGAFIITDTRQHFRKKELHMPDFRLAGITGNNKAIWMDNVTSNVMSMSPDLKYSIISCTPARLPQLPITGRPLALNEKSTMYDPDKDIIYNMPVLAFKTIVPLKDTPGHYLFISHFSLGKFYAQKNTETHIDADRYANLLVDSTRDRIWTYTKNKIVFFADNKLTTLQTKHAKLLISRVIEKMAVEQQFGSIFIKTDGKLLFYDYEKDTSAELLPNISLKEATFSVVRNKLMVYGRFGLGLYNIAGKGKIEEVAIYRNIKNTFFNSVSDVYWGNDSILLNTDKGVYTVPAPEHLNSGNAAPDYVHRIFVAYYNNQVFGIKTGDTIAISKDQPNIRFDVINALANGRAKYALVIDGITTELNANEFSFPSTWGPDNYYTVTLYTSDRIWRSDALNLVIYMQPKWYQTKNMVRFIWFSVIFFAVLIVVVSVLITRRLVTRANKKRNAQMELELKSIYAQINPHFIFNSLNSALLLVSKNKMEDAYNHISKFSRLLRSYIKSSRNKYILLSEEIKNLTNYIDLQQTRFKEKFAYSITVAEDLEATIKWIPSLLLQPFVENAIEHGLLPKEEMGMLSISFEKGNADNVIICTIDDDGIGRKESKLNKTPNPTKEDSYGELLIKDLVSIFNKYEHMHIHVSYRDKEQPLTGTVVTIKINVNERSEI